MVVMIGNLRTNTWESWREIRKDRRKKIRWYKEEEQVFLEKKP